MFENLRWLGHASFRMEGERTIYIDPWKLKGGPGADIILVSHAHYDHYSQADIDKVRKPGTVIVASADIAPKAGGDSRALQPGGKIKIGGVTVEGIPAYNIGKAFHPKSNGWLGFVVEMGGERLYYAGDTDRVPEMSQLRDIDIALLPVGGTYTMDAADAAGAAQLIKPGMAIPYHYGDIVGGRADAERFAALYGGRVEILDATV